MVSSSSSNHDGDGGEMLRGSMTRLQQQQPCFNSLESPPMTMRKQPFQLQGGINDNIVISAFQQQERHDQDRDYDTSMPVASLFGALPRKNSIGKSSLLRRGNPYVSSIQSIASTATSIDLTEEDRNIDDMMEDDDTLIPSDNDDDDELLFGSKKRPADIHPAGKEDANLTPPSKEQPPSFLRIHNFEFDTWRNNTSHRNNSCLETIKSFDSQSSTASTSGSSANTTPLDLKHSDTSDKPLEEDPFLKEETTEFCTGAKVRKLNLDDHPYNAHDNDNNLYPPSKSRQQKRLDFASSRINDISPQQTPLVVDCKQNQYAHDDNKKHYTYRENENISPTDIFGFPQMKDTPPRPKHNQTHTYSLSSPSRNTASSHYNQIYNNNLPPQTPVLVRKKNKLSPIEQFGCDSPSNKIGNQQNTYNMIGSLSSTLERSNVPKTPLLSTPQKSKPNGILNRNISTNAAALGPTNAIMNHQLSRFTSDFEIISVIGNGCFGTVYKCKSKLDGCRYAIKATKRAARGPLDRDRMLKEVYALAAICDQADTATFHIVRYHQAWMDDDQKLYIQTELCTSTLQHEMQKNKFIHNIPRRYKLLREMLLALQFIHKNKMVHLDIKPDNIFIKDDQFKLGDFGLASKQAKGGFDDDIQEGDSRYMSMDLLREDHHDLTKSDVFSLGATMYEICINRDLPSEGQEWQDIRAGKLSSMEITNTPEELVSIIKTMMNPKIDLRPSASELLKKKPLLSEEEKLLILEKNKVLEANLALAAQKIKFKKLTPPKKILLRSNTWNGQF